MMIIMSIVLLRTNSPSNRNFNPVIILNLPNDLSSLHVYIRLYLTLTLTQAHNFRMQLYLFITDLNFMHQ